ncbi:MAG: glycoside hydrolase family 65 protein [Gorillibacterium sp.]|nr:glycoside hydrolase family 65 protein [Gorillibacterium sp.]
MSWTVTDNGFTQENIAKNGNTFMIGNGYMGYRGTLEEYKKEQLVAVTLAGLYDKVGDKWREPVNAPNGLWTQLYLNHTPLNVLQMDTQQHFQEVDFRFGIHRRQSVFLAPDGNQITFKVERFASMDNLHLLAAKASICCSEACELTVETGIDGEVWDINGPHLDSFHSNASELEQPIVLSAISGELKVPVSIAQSIRLDGGEQELVHSAPSIYRRIRLHCQAGVPYTFESFVSVYSGRDGVAKPEVTAVHDCQQALSQGWDVLRQKHDAKWEEKWALSDVTIEGDEEAQFALRYSIYQLLIIAPTESEKVSIPARGLSGQVYKGAVFWDTEMFMLPFFLHTDPGTARNIMMYRCHTLEGARRKATEYGFEGAFYAWESQDSGDDACTLFNVTDVFTGRPMRTYFRDKQVHISADVARGIWQYYSFTGDESILLEGGAEVILEVARFFYSYAYYNTAKERYEILDVTGPDEYHERVNNNAFTNYLVKQALEITLETINLLKERHPEVFTALVEKINYQRELVAIPLMLSSMYVPLPDLTTGVIEQFDRYNTLEEVSVKALKERMLDKHEYLGGGNGLATTTKVLKQADVVLMLHLFKDHFVKSIKQANWEYYEPRTEHGSSLSPCVYALVASDIGSPDWAYPYFMRTATIDLTGESKQYVGNLYIGGTHPAANGGAWMAAILGFAGVHFHNGVVHIQPAMPKDWTSIGFSLKILGQSYTLRVTADQVEVISLDDNTRSQSFCVAGRELECVAGQFLIVNDLTQDQRSTEEASVG